jgi:paraquat-inducible protein B
MRVLKMAKGASKTMIGGFVVTGLILVIVAVAIFGSGTFFSKRYKVVLFFKESVSGLNVGAPVVFRGVTIGSVVGVELWTYPKELRILVPVYIEFDPSRFREKGDGISSPEQNLQRQIEKGLRAQLKLQSMVTGQMMIYVDYFPNKPIRLVKADLEYPEIPTIPSGTEEIMKALEEIPVQETAIKATKAIDGIEKLVNSKEIKETIRNLNEVMKGAQVVVQKVDGGLDQSTAAIQDIRKLVERVDARIDPLSTEIHGALTDSRKLIRQADGQILPLVTNLRTTLEEAGKVLDEARVTLKKTSETISGESTLSVEVINSLEEMNRTMRSIQSLADFLKQHPDSLLRGKKPDGGR